MDKQKILTSMNECVKLRKQYNIDLGNALVEAGLALVPCDYLSDNTVIVSRSVYEAIKKEASGGDHGNRT